jgi:hypothetical protein
MNHGGPYEMKTLEGKQAGVFTNILIGDVWLGSGQSNSILGSGQSDMEWVVKQ